MGMYTGIRFKGVVKKDFRDLIEVINTNGYWIESTDPVFKKFGEYPGSVDIPLFELSYMPKNWGDYIDGKFIEDPKFINKFDNTTGHWVFQCSIKNYNSTIEEWFDILPYFIESIEHLEYYYEEWEYSSKYELINNEIQCTNSEFIRYRDDRY